VEPMPDDRDARWRYTVQLSPMSVTGYSLWTIPP
jgi:hypothetical protein